MDLKIKDVSELLGVSEITVHRWLSDGKIPAYRIDGEARFSRMEVEDWILKNNTEELFPIPRKTVKLITGLFEIKISLNIAVC